MLLIPESMYRNGAISKSQLLAELADTMASSIKGNGSAVPIMLVGDPAQVRHIRMAEQTTPSCVGCGFVNEPGVTRCGACGRNH